MMIFEVVLEELADVLYRRFGFKDYKPDKPSPYEHADVFMEWQGGRG